MLIFAAATAFRVLILLFGQRWADGDESVVGVMALHILRGDRPLYFMGQSYAGGGAVEAYLAALLFRIVGPSSIALKTVPLLFSLASLVLFYAVADKAWGRRAALVVAAVAAVASPLVELNLKARGGHAEIPFYAALALFLFMRLEQRRARDLVGLGVVIGFAYYSLEMIAPLLLALGIYCVALQRYLPRPRSVALVLLGLFIGLFPCLLFNYRHDNANFHYIFREVGSTAVSFEMLRTRLLDQFPQFFQGRNVDAYLPSLEWPAYLEAAIFSVLACVGGWFACRRLSVDRPRRIDLGLVCTVQLLLAFLVVIVGTRTEQGPRFFLPLFLPLMLLACSTISQMLVNPRRITRHLGFCAALVLIASGLATNVRYLQASWVNDDYYVTTDSPRSIKVPGKWLEKTIAFLTAEGIDRVRAPYFVQWRLIFETQERIIASSVGFFPHGYRYPAYDQAVARAETAAVLTHKLSRDNEDFFREGSCYVWASKVPGVVYSDPRRYLRTALDDYFVYLPVARSACVAE